MGPLLCPLIRPVPLIEPANTLSTHNVETNYRKLFILLCAMVLSTCLAPCDVPCGKVCAAPCERPLSASVCRSTLCGALLQGCAAPIVAAQGCGRLLTHCRCTGHPTDRSQAATPGGSKADYRACHALYSAQGESQGAPKGIIWIKKE